MQEGSSLWWRRNVGLSRGSPFISVFIFLQYVGLGDLLSSNGGNTRSELPLRPEGWELEIVLILG